MKVPLPTKVAANETQEKLKINGEREREGPREREGERERGRRREREREKGGERERGVPMSVTCAGTCAAVARIIRLTLPKRERE